MKELQINVEERNLKDVGEALKEKGLLLAKCKDCGKLFVLSKFDGLGNSSNYPDDCKHRWQGPDFDDIELTEDGTAPVLRHKFEDWEVI